MEDRSRILIVDDDPDIRRVLTLLLRDSYEISQAADGAAALKLLKAQGDTDLVVLDVMMPGMDGFETCAQIRAFSKVPILFLTAKSAEEDLLRAYAGGGDDFLSKPFSPGEFTAKVRSLLRRWQEYRGKPAAALDLGGLEVDRASRSVRRGGKEIADRHGVCDPGASAGPARQDRHDAGDVRGRLEGAFSPRLGQHRDGACAEPAPEGRGGPLESASDPYRMGKGISN